MSAPVHAVRERDRQAADVPHVCMNCLGSWTRGPSDCSVCHTPRATSADPSVARLLVAILRMRLEDELGAVFDQPPCVRGAFCASTTPCACFWCTSRRREPVTEDLSPPTTDALSRLSLDRLLADLQLFEAAPGR